MMVRTRQLTRIIKGSFLQECSYSSTVVWVRGELPLQDWLGEVSRVIVQICDTGQGACLYFLPKVVGIVTHRGRLAP